MSHPIQPAQIDWREDDNGNTVPVSRQFGDVYFSLVDGLAESRYVFIERNELPTRLAKIIADDDYQTFTIGELGFGTGLNFFATWQLWNEIRSTHNTLNDCTSNAQLHFISFEKFPLTKADMKQALASWADKEPKIAPLIDKLINAYPTLIAGCHRLSFPEYNLTLDIWLGDATDNLAKLATDDAKADALVDAKNAKIDAWFLDGFAPSCNESLWAEQIFSQISRLSSPTATAATFSCAGVVKRGFKNIGFDIAKVKGFGRKREMLTAWRDVDGRANDAESKNNVTDVSNVTNVINATDVENKATAHSKPPKTALVIGAGVSGLMTAWALANRGVHITLVDKTAPLAGASGNPRGLLSPKMTPLHHVPEHLHSIGYLYSSRLYRQMNELNVLNGKNQPIRPVLEPTGALDLLLNSNVDTTQISAYPADFAHVLDEQSAKQKTGLSKQDLSNNQYLPQAGLVNPQALAKVVMAHPLIEYQQAEVLSVEENNTTTNPIAIAHTTAHTTVQTNGGQITADQLVICTADKSCQIDKRIFDFRKIRGQLSWFTPSAKQLASLPKIPLKYGGYCATFTPVTGDDIDNKVEVGTPSFLLGASFIRNDLDSEVREAEHHISREKLTTAIPELANVIDDDVRQWQARVGIRSQTPDYHPLVGLVGNSKRIWTMSGMGAKGYAYAPICSQVLADMMMGAIPPLPASMIEQLSPNRKRLQQPLNHSR